ncbi:hypothetical protein G4422_15135 [Blautia wexlerae]|uniref:hypothetical protein n=1 Tax=Blautia wexlerae TaxID=418240 RepID=UPI00156E2B42|nr:hypothetical protein [Blautia wexlerae]NSE04722.1 hypothetical protein [Blautia wexlerae]NSF78371.1 hypothetical protein [Blautia wexlerae]
MERCDRSVSIVTKISWCRKLLYINELGIADTAFYYDTEEQHQKALTGRTCTNGGILAVRIGEHLHSKKRYRTG